MKGEKTKNKGRKQREDRNKQEIDINRARDGEKEGEEKKYTVPKIMKKDGVGERIEETVDDGMMKGERGEGWEVSKITMETADINKSWSL